MTLPAKAIVDTVPNFLENLKEVEAFFKIQDEGSAQGRFAELKRQLREMVSILGWSPASGRPARFCNTRSAQGLLQLDAVLRLAEQVGLSDLREYVVEKHVVLYAHSASEIVLLAIKHERQLRYALAGSGN